MKITWRDCISSTYCVHNILFITSLRARVCVYHQLVWLCIVTRFSSWKLKFSLFLKKKNCGNMATVINVYCMRRHILTNSDVWCEMESERKKLSDIIFIAMLINHRLLNWQPEWSLLSQNAVRTVCMRYLFIYFNFYCRWLHCFVRENVRKKGCDFPANTSAVAWKWATVRNMSKKINEQQPRFTQTA